MTDKASLVNNAEPLQFDAPTMDRMETGQTQQQSVLSTSSHPIALIFHVLFRSLAVVVYLLNGFFTSGFILTFVLITLLLSFDFWTVKNVSGRLLVGLRWWNEIKDDGDNVWVFESKPDRSPNATDSRIFWWTLYIFELLWAIFAFISLIKFNFGWLLLCGVALALNTANLMGYWKCDNDARARLSSLSGGWMGNLMTNALTSRVTSMFSR